MTQSADFDVDFCRTQFPLLVPDQTTGELPDVYFENAGGSYVPKQVIERISTFMATSQTQPEWPFAASKRAKAQMEHALKGVAEWFNISPDELVIGPSTTLNAYVLANALRPNLEEGDAIVVTNQDHEANGGCWRRWADTGIEVREWRVDPITGDLDPADLDPLLSDGQVKLVCFPHVSNIVGSVNDVASITAKAHLAGALVCVDGVATVAHHLPDLKVLDVDFYLFSFYKLFGPHLAMMYARQKTFDHLTNQNHYFHDGKGILALNPGGQNYESVGAIGGILDYIDAVYQAHTTPPLNDRRARALAVFRMFQAQEEALSAHFLTWLKERDDLRLIGRAESTVDRRAATFSLQTLGNKTPMEIAEALAHKGIAVGAGHFYAKRCLEGVNVDPEIGVLRISMVHYNTLAEVDRLTQALSEILA